MKVFKTFKLALVSVFAIAAVFSSPFVSNADGGDPWYWVGEGPSGYGCYEIFWHPVSQVRSIDAQIPWIYWGASCPGSTAIGSVRGSAFLDNNANGTWEPEESIFGEAWYKVTDGGTWFTCGWVGDDATYGVTVNPGTYYVLPVAPKGFKTTTPRVTVQVNDGAAALNANIGFVADATAPGDACDQYNPPRP